jgi:hypothetical protein
MSVCFDIAAQAGNRRAACTNKPPCFVTCSDVLQYVVRDKNVVKIWL